MKRIMVLTILLVAIGLTLPTYAQPTTQPVSPATKVEAKTTPPATMVPAKVAGEVTVAPVEVKAEEKTEDMQSWWQHLLITLISIFGTIAVPVLSTLAILLLKRWNIKVEYDKAEWVANKAKDYAEQKARVALKDGKPLNAEGIKKVALEKGRELGEGNLAPWVAKFLTDLIEAKLGSDNKDKPVTNGEGIPTTVTG